jgi:hypothetical protein
MNTKSFLLGCAAGVIALSGAQAADLPVKAKPIQYVKICSLYGAGFYYIPGTDTCIKIGGFVRAQVEANSFDGFSYGSTNGAFGPSTITDGQFSRVTNGLNFTGRGTISADARTQTEYGTVRSYMRVGFQTTTSGSTTPGFFGDRAFIQFAGFTFGLTQSFFDVFSNTELFTYTDAKTSGDTYNHGVTAWAYTASFGNGVTATLAAEALHNPAGVINGSSTGFGFNGTTALATEGTQIPDFVGNVRWDQNWGYVGASGAVHKVAATYYGGAPLASNGHPDDKYGWAGQIGGLVHLPGDNTFGVSFVGTEGALGYATKAGSWQIFNDGSVGVGWLSDGLYDSVTPGDNKQIHLTTAWSVNAGFEHLWNQHWQTSLYGGYTKVSYDSAATFIANTHLPTPPTAPGVACGAAVLGSVWPPIALNHGEANSCSPNFSFWQVGTRTQWNLDSSTYMGLDVNYTHLNTAYKGPLVAPYATGTQSATSVDDQDVWSAILRVQRSFYP